RCLGAVWAAQAGRPGRIGDESGEARPEGTTPTRASRSTSGPARWSTSAGNTPQKLAQRAGIILLAAAGQPNAAIAREVGVSRPTVLLWHARFARGGRAGSFPSRSHGRDASPH